MHAFTHAVTDTLALLKRPSHKKENRLLKFNNRDACRKNRIFPFMYVDLQKKPKFPWSVSKLVEKQHDAKLKNTIGSKSVNIPQKIYKRGHGKTSHESIMYAIHGWAQWCLHDENNVEIQPYLDIKIELFNLLSILNACRIKWSDVNNIRDRLISLLVNHSALFPPIEQTYALHELIHICDQIPEIGPSYFNNLFQVILHYIIM